MLSLFVTLNSLTHTLLHHNSKYVSWPRRNAVKCHITADHLQTSLFIPIHVTAVGIIDPVEFAREASHVQYRSKSWENLDLTM